MFVLATAGHVDHGKSTLLKALTGMEPDRLPEEKKRGLTINLNFLWADFEGAGRVGFIDVPGHHRFVGNMISGISEVSGYILVVAADDGWMPQTEEHLLILKSFNIQNGILVISKTDLSNSERVERLKFDSLKKIEAMLGEAPEAFTFSNKSSPNVEEIQAGISRLLSKIPKPLDGSTARVWIDRAFVPQGLGVVVTGTLTEGALQEGDKLFLWPGDHNPEIRSIQSCGVPKERMDPTSRIAIQLSKVSRGDVGMGSLLSKGGLHLSRRMDCVLDYLKAPLRKNTQATFYFGTLEEDCLIVPVSEGSQSIARILFKRPIPARFADRFIIRTHGEEYLLAAGWVADPNARSKTHRSLKELLSGANPTLDFFLRVEAVLEGTLRIPELLHRSAFSRNNFQTNLNSSDFESLDADNYVSKSALPNIKKEIVNLLNTKGPLNQKEIKKALLIKHPVALIESTLQLGNQAGWWEIRGQQVTPVQKDQPLSDGEKRLLESIASPPHLWERDELLKRVETEGALKKLVKAGELIPLKDGLFTSGKFYKEMERRVEEFLKKNGKATTSELKAVLGGVSRKYAIPLLEKMDENRLTYLKNGVRQLLK